MMPLLLLLLLLMLLLLLLRRGRKRRRRFIAIYDNRRYITFGDNFLYWESRSPSWAPFGNRICSLFFFLGTMEWLKFPRRDIAGNYLDGGVFHGDDEQTCINRCGAEPSCVSCVIYGIPPATTCCLKSVSQRNKRINNCVNCWGWFLKLDINPEGKTVSWYIFFVWLIF